MPIKTRAKVIQMLLYLLKGKSIGQRTIFRQIRSSIILLVIIGSYWLIKPSLLPIYYVLTALIIMVLLYDHQQSKKVLADHSINFTDIMNIIITDLFLIGTVIITGAAQSPLIDIVLIPIILFTAEFGTTTGIWNYIGLSIFLIINSVLGVSVFTLRTLAVPLTFLITGGACLFAIGALHYFQTRFTRKVSRLLTRDELTGLYNRRFLKFFVSNEIKTKKSFGFILIDINFFKYYNDFWGHSAGDNLLINIGKVLSKSVRSQDIVVRHSGDEFIIMLPESNQTEVEKSIYKIVQSIESYNFPGEECFPGQKLSISYGFTIFPSEAHHYQDLFTAADQALYRYKKERCQ